MAILRRDQPNNDWAVRRGTLGDVSTTVRCRTRVEVLPAAAGRFPACAGLQGWRCFRTTEAGSHSLCYCCGSSLGMCCCLFAGGVTLRVCYPRSNPA